MNIIIKLPLRHSSLPIILTRRPIILLHRNLTPIHLGNPRHVPRTPAIMHRHGILLGRLIHGNPRPAPSLVPRVGVSEVLAFVLVCELLVEAVVDAPGDEGGALAFVEVPFVDAAAGAGGFVGVVVRAAGEGVGFWVGYGSFWGGWEGVGGEGEEEG